MAPRVPHKSRSLEPNLEFKVLSEPHISFFLSRKLKHLPFPRTDLVQHEAFNRHVLDDPVAAAAVAVGRDGGNPDLREVLLTDLPEEGTLSAILLRRWTKVLYRLDLSEKAQAARQLCKVFLRMGHS